MPQPFVPGGPARYAHQRAGLAKILQHRGRGALIFDPGMGKSAVALDYASIMALKMDRPVRVLVLAPLAAANTWTQQAQAMTSPLVGLWAEALGGSVLQRAEALTARGTGDHEGWRRSHALVTNSDYDTAPGLQLIIVNYDSFNSREPAYRHRKSGPTRQAVMVAACKQFRPDLIIADESHLLRGPHSNTSRAVARLSDITHRRLILTGTIMPHSPLDVFGQWRFLDPTAFGTTWPGEHQVRPPSFSVFRERFAVMGGWMGKQAIGFRNLDQMRAVMADLSSVAHKADALDLPPVTDTRVPVLLSAREARAYAEMKATLAAQLDDGTLLAAPNRLTQMMRLRQITSGFLNDQAGVPQMLGQAKVRTAASLVNDTLAGERRVVVFAHFRTEIEMLRRALAVEDTQVCTITGDTPEAARQAIRHRFGSSENSRIVLVAQMRTMSLAVNELVTANHAVYLSMSERREDWIQSRDRLDRIGQTRPVTIWTLVVEGTVDEVLLSSHQQRTDLEAAMLKHLKDAA